MKSIIATLAVASAATAMWASAIPASAQLMPRFNSRPSVTFQGASGQTYQVHTQRQGRSIHDFDDRRPRSNRGWGHSSGSYFGY